jgi:hypothetical protein
MLCVFRARRVAERKTALTLAGHGLTFRQRHADAHTSQAQNMACFTLW